MAVLSIGSTTIHNEGSIIAEANSGNAFAIYTEAQSGTADEQPTLTSSGEIHAYSETGQAIGVFVRNGGDVINDGLITADGGQGAVGVDLSHHHGGWLLNRGTIHAFAPPMSEFFAVGVALNSSILTNEGTITADIAVLVTDLYGYGFSTIVNSGLLGGAILQVQDESNVSPYFGTEIDNQAGGTIVGPILMDRGSPNAHVVRNQGEILADVWLGAGKDVFDGRGGTFHGTVYGLGGDDRLTGGSGIDVAGYEGASVDFTLVRHADGRVVGIDSNVSDGLDEGSDTLIGIETIYFAGDAAVIELPGLTVDDPRFRLLAEDGLAARIGGSGAIFGSAGFQDIAVIDTPGAISFDPSFNRGGNIIRFAGNAHSWQIGRVGSNAVLTNGEMVVDIPMGIAATALVFDDGVRSLRYDAGQSSAMIGNQSFASELVTVTAPADSTPLPTGADSDARGRIILAADGAVTADGGLDVYGTQGQETVGVLGGEITLDPSFNKGGDTVTFALPAAQFTAMREGSSIILESSSATIVIPVGPAGATLAFGADERALHYDTSLASIVIGNQQIGFDPIALAAIV